MSPIFLAARRNIKVFSAVEAFYEKMFVVGFFEDKSLVFAAVALVLGEFGSFFFRGSLNVETFSRMFCNKNHFFAFELLEKCEIRIFCLIFTRIAN